jgi:hypothetical protein
VSFTLEYVIAESCRYRETFRRSDLTICGEYWRHNQNSTARFIHRRHDQIRRVGCLPLSEMRTVERPHAHKSHHSRGSPDYAPTTAQYKFLTIINYLDVNPILRVTSTPNQSLETD